jgi:N-acetyl-D-muramate 6-phosphate phosphatase
VGGHPRRELLSRMSLDIPRIRALCFDVDGTLRDTDDQYVARFARLLAPFRFLAQRHDVRPIARRMVMAIESPATLLYSLPDRIGIDNHLENLTEALHRLNPGRTPETFAIVSGVQGMLERLSQRYPLAIISARSERTTDAFLDSYQLTRYFGCVATATTCAHAKPYPDQILWAAAQLGVPASACLMIGDTTVDIRAGRHAGAQTVGVLCGFGEERELRNAGADQILASTAQLVDALELESGVS